MNKDGKTCSYLLRDIPDDLWLKVRHYSIDNKISARDMLLEALEEYMRARGTKQGKGKGVSS